MLHKLCSCSWILCSCKTRIVQSVYSHLPLKYPTRSEVVCAYLTIYCCFWLCRSFAQQLFKPVIEQCAMLWYLVLLFKLQGKAVGGFTSWYSGITRPFSADDGVKERRSITETKTQIFGQSNRVSNNSTATS